jgi:hypothetical protein
MASGTIERGHLIYTPVTEPKLLGPNVLCCTLSSLNAIYVSINLERMCFRPLVQQFKVATCVIFVKFRYEKVTFFTLLKADRCRIDSAHD